MPEFNATDFIARLGNSLCYEFEEARPATTLPLVGAATETPVLRLLASPTPPPT